ncbi:hypothetical protein ACIGXM_03710 [Kitasatospora sp. NPDC052896]|uniref:hypothetical protein n=1 Tax=Kitasatospora sp. NPDC052896 TaxID=3364061 RepID=UPI0037CBA398
MTLPTLAFACPLVVTLGYGLLCAISPFGRCRKCSGLGHQPRTGRLIRRPKTCRRCDGTGLRLRIGRRLHHHGNRATEGARRLRDDATH